MIDIPNWPEWDDGLVSSRLDDPSKDVVDGANGLLTMKGRGDFAFVLADLEENKYFSYDVELKGAHTNWFWDFSRDTSDDAGFVLIMGVTVTGWATPMYRWWIKRECEEAFERSLLRLQDMCEEPVKLEMVSVATASGNKSVPTGLLI